MTEKIKKTELIRTNRKPDGTFGAGNTANPTGRPKETSERKIIRKATKELIADYKKTLTNALPLIGPILISQALKGDIQSIKEVHDRAMGKSPQPLVGGDDDWKPIQIIIATQDDKTTPDPE